MRRALLMGEQLEIDLLSTSAVIKYSFNEKANSVNFIVNRLNWLIAIYQYHR